MGFSEPISVLLIVGIIALGGIAIAIAMPKLKDAPWFLNGTLAVYNTIDPSRSLNWRFTLSAGLLLSILSAGIGGIAEFAIIAIISILLMIRKYLAEKLPKWLDKAVDNAVITFLTSLILYGLGISFFALTGINLDSSH